jgi:hypothetical protein
VVRDPYARWCDRENPRGSTYVNLQILIVRTADRARSMNVERNTQYKEEHISSDRGEPHLPPTQSANLDNDARLQSVINIDKLRFFILDTCLEFG